MLSLTFWTRTGTWLLAVLLGADVWAQDLSAWSVDDKIGQLFMVGYRSDEQVLRMRPAGVALFSWSLKDVGHAHALALRLKKMGKEQLKSPLFIAIDHEGGQVLRLRRGLTNFPDAAAIGATRDPVLARRVGEAMGEELSALGVNMNLAPVLDLGNSRSFLQNRIWGAEGSPVGEMTSSFIVGLQSRGVLAVAKHFPGHGRSSVDSHFALPRLDVSLEELWRQDLAPFRQAQIAGVKAVMSAHVVIPSVDKVPASMSPKFLTELLRKKLGFEGLIFTDDLEMGGVTDWGDAGEVGLRALKAGSDILLVVWSEEAQRKAEARIKRALRDGEISVEEIDSKVRRILRVKKELAVGESQGHADDPKWRAKLMTPSSLALVEEVLDRALEWVGGDSRKGSQALVQRWAEPWTVVLPRERFVSVWKALRPQDDLHVVPRRVDEAGARQLAQQMKVWIGMDRPVVVLTGPRAVSDERVFSEIRIAMNGVIKREPKSPFVLWAHQGGSPVAIRKDLAHSRMGIVSLHTSSQKGISELLKLLKDGAGDTRGSQLR
ncbi:MAG: beta-N-acetylhexosaminidase [Bdellovibrionales bacterium]|nr:beta-N-acetylhexosaminidase [Bdellovibrionales bacterium]